MEKYKNKYRIPSARLQNWDYGANAAYFLTICTQNRECYFGNIHNGHIELSEIGILTDHYWKQIPEQFPYAVLHPHIVMPNHIHGIIEIAKFDVNSNDISIDDRYNDPDCDPGRDAINRVSTSTSSSKTNVGGFAKNKNPMVNENISRIIRWYKGVVTFHSRKIHADFAWQSRFHDHIIRNQQSFDKIKSYIIDNPSKWTDDKFFKK